MDKLYKYETHMHTSQGSACSPCSGAAMVEGLKEFGYTGCFITDHFFGGNTAVDRRLPWEIKVHLFCQGYEDAKRRGDEIGVDVFFGWEFGRHGTEFLTYGLDKQFLLDHPEIDWIDLPKYADLVHENGGFLVHAHPFREASYLDTIRLFPRCVDGVEAFNVSQDPDFNLRAKWYAESYGLPVTGGSDAHSAWGFNGGGIALDEKLESPADYLNRLREGRITKILERSDEYMRPRPENLDEITVRPDISLLPDDLRAEAERFYSK